MRSRNEIPRTVSCGRACTKIREPASTQRAALDFRRERGPSKPLAKKFYTSRVFRGNRALCGWGEHMIAPHVQVQRETADWRTCIAAMVKCCASSLSRWSVKLLSSASFLKAVAKRRILWHCRLASRARHSRSTRGIAARRAQATRQR